MNVLAIGAHPDDVEVSAGGTLAKYNSLGHKVFIATATNGNIGSATLSMEEIARVRKEEARKAAAHINAEYICLDYDDEMFFESREARLAFINLVRYCKADVILTHNLTDYNPDHELTAKIVRDITVMIPIAKLKTESKPHDVIPAIYHWESVHGHGFLPTHYVDITDFIEVKKKMCSEHVSQIAWVEDNHQFIPEEGENFFSESLITSRFRGIQSRVRYAEAFRLADNANAVRAGSLLP
ncbi:MAG TPA: PIG-L family deacetylase [Clostridiaceae bacterium]|nr:PIG-L family deacetylase [Clostridiaceae bacterium]